MKELILKKGEIGSFYLDIVFHISRTVRYISKVDNPTVDINNWHEWNICGLDGFWLPIQAVIIVMCINHFIFLDCSGVLKHLNPSPLQHWDGGKWSSSSTSNHPPSHTKLAHRMCTQKRTFWSRSFCGQVPKCTLPSWRHNLNSKEKYYIMYHCYNHYLLIKTSKLKHKLSNTQV